MKLLRSAALAALGLALVAGCSQKGGAANTAAGAPGGSASAPASGPDTAITEADLPHPKAGLWEVSMTTDGAPAEVSRHCESAATIKPPQANPECSKFEMKRTFLGAVVFDISCNAGPVSSTIHATATGDFNSSYSSDTVATITLQGQPPKTIKTHTDAHYVGPCAPGSASDRPPQN